MHVRVNVWRMHEFCPKVTKTGSNPATQHWQSTKFLKVQASQSNSLCLDDKFSQGEATELTNRKDCLKAKCIIAIKNSGEIGNWF